MSRIINGVEIPKASESMPDAQSAQGIGNVVRELSARYNAPEGELSEWALWLWRLGFVDGALMATGVMGQMIDKTGANDE